MSSSRLGVECSVVSGEILCWLLAGTTCAGCVNGVCGVSGGRSVVWSTGVVLFSDKSAFSSFAGTDLFTGLIRE